MWTCCILWLALDAVGLPALWLLARRAPRREDFPQRPGEN